MPDSLNQLPPPDGDDDRPDRDPDSPAPDLVDPTPRISPTRHFIPDSLSHMSDTTSPSSSPAYPMRVYSFGSSATGSPNQNQGRSKRRQVKNACTNCQKACKKCDDARPCLRCVKYGIGEECVDSQRKERRKGVKRGPYKKRDGKSSYPDDASSSSPLDGATVPSSAPPAGIGLPPNPAAATAAAVAAAAAATPTAVPMSYMPHMQPVGYSPAPFYGQYKPGDPPPPTYYHPSYYMPMPLPPPGSNAPDDTQGPISYPMPHFYPPPYVPYGSYAPYVVHPAAPPRPDPGVGGPAGPQYVSYSPAPPPGYARPPVLHPLTHQNNHHVGSPNGVPVNGAAQMNGGAAAAAGASPSALVGAEGHV